MDINEVFNKSVLIEEKLADFYREAAGICEVKRLSEQLMKISQDEDGHKDLLRIGVKYAVEAPEAFKINQETEEMIGLGLESCQDILNKVRKDECRLKVVLSEAQRLEKFFKLFHLNAVADIKIESLKQLFNSLAQDCESHANSLSNIISEL